MDMRERVVDGITVLDISGKIILGEGDVQIRERIKELLADGQKRILLNLGDVTYMDSAGLGGLISSYATVKRETGQLKLVNLGARVQDLLSITKLITVFESYDDENTALGSFKA